MSRTVSLEFLEQLLWQQWLKCRYDLICLIHLRQPEWKKWFSTVSAGHEIWNLHLVYLKLSFKKLYFSHLNPCNPYTNCRLGFLGRLALTHQAGLRSAPKQKPNGLHLKSLKIGARPRITELDVLKAWLPIRGCWFLQVVPLVPVTPACPVQRLPARPMALEALLFSFLKSKKSQAYMSVCTLEASKRP